MKSRKSLKEANNNYGYHAGDLGKAEDRRIQTGSRGTGHFGTGTYFVSNPDKIKNYNSRDGQEAPKHIVDFSNYKLFKPRRVTQAYDLHDALKVINNDYRYFSKIGDVFDWYRKNERKYKSEYGNINIESKDIPEVVDKLNRLGYNIELPKDINWDTIDDEWETLYDKVYDEVREQYPNADYSERHRIIDEILDKEEKFIKQRKVNYEVIKDFKNAFEWWKLNAYENYRKLVSTLRSSLDYKHSEEEIKNALKEVDKHLNDKSGDSLSTIFMKALGYEGIDVRHLKDEDGLATPDNTGYGSVIYDLKDGTIVESPKTDSNIENRLDFKSLVENDMNYRGTSKKPKLSEKYANNLHNRFLDYLKHPEKINLQKEVNCVNSTAYNLLQSYNDDSMKDIKLCIGCLSYDKDEDVTNALITHFWLNVDGEDYASNEPNGTYRILKHSLDIDKNKDLFSQVKDFLKLEESLLTEVYPNKGESKKDFTKRFMKVTKDEYPDVKQRYAVCMSYWDRRNKKRKKNESLDDKNKIHSFIILDLDKEYCYENAKFLKLCAKYGVEVDKKQHNKLDVTDVSDSNYKLFIKELTKLDKKLGEAELQNKAKEEIKSHPTNILYRVGKVPNTYSNDSLFFTDDLEYYTHSRTGYNKKDAEAYEIDFKNAKIFDPMVEWEDYIYSVDAWAAIRISMPFAEELGLYCEYIDGDDDYEVIIDTDSLADYGQENGYDITIIRDIPNGYGRSYEGVFTEYAIHNSKVIKKRLGKAIKESLNENIDEDTITLYTVQDKKVLDKLNKGETYIASYNNIFDMEYLDLYKKLSSLYGFKNCPIFCADEDSLHIIESSGIEATGNRELITLNVPRSEVKVHNYYDWTDYLFFHIDDDGTFETEEELNEYLLKLEDRMKNQVCGDDEDKEYVIDRIEPSWVVKSNNEV